MELWLCYGIISGTNHLKHPRHCFGPRIRLAQSSTCKCLKSARNSQNHFSIWRLILDIQNDDSQNPTIWSPKKASRATRKAHFCFENVRRWLFVSMSWSVLYSHNVTFTPRFSLKTLKTPNMTLVKIPIFNVKCIFKWLILDCHVSFQRRKETLIPQLFRDS